MIELIKRKKAAYGCNFADIAKVWCGIICTEILPEDVAEMMAQMKECRIKAIKEKLDDPKCDNQEQLLKALEDSQKDKAAYTWISENFEEYQKL